MTAIPSFQISYNEIIDHGLAMTESKQADIHMCACLTHVIEITSLIASSAQIYVTMMNEANDLTAKLNIDLSASQSGTVENMLKNNPSDDDYNNKYVVYYTQFSNQQISSQRELLQQMLGSVQQISQTCQASVNTAVNELMQMTKAANSLLSSMQDLLYISNLRKPPQFA